MFIGVLYYHLLLLHNLVPANNREERRGQLSMSKQFNSTTFCRTCASFGKGTQGIIICRGVLNKKAKLEKEKRKEDGKASSCERYSLLLRTMVMYRIASQYVYLSFFCFTGLNSNFKSTIIAYRIKENSSTRKFT